MSHSTNTLGTFIGSYTFSARSLFPSPSQCHSAIEPRQREDWAKQMAQLLEADGELVTLIFPVASPPFAGGPPYCMSVDLVRDLVSSRFEEVAVEEVAATDLARGHMRGAKEFLGRWRRKP